MSGVLIFGLRFFEYALVQTANGADPIFGNLFPGGAGGNAVIRIAYSGIVFIAAGANVFHSRFSLYSSDLFAIESKEAFLVIPYLVAGVGLPAVGAVIQNLKSLDQEGIALECDGETGYFLEQDLIIRTLAGKLQQKGGAAVLCLENQAVDQDFLTGKLFCNVHRLILTMLFGDS